MHALLLSRRFAPFFVVQALGALNDNLFKNGLALFLVYQLGQDESGSRTWINLAAGLFILPFFLFSPRAGELADRMDKARLIRWIKLSEIGVMLLGSAAFLMASPTGLLLATFLMGLQSAFFGPVKYSLLPQCLSPAQLPRGNALVAGGTFLAILAGTLGATLLAAQQRLPEGLVGAVLTVAVAGWLAALAIPSLPPVMAPAASAVSGPALPRVLHTWWQAADLRRPVLGISFFWFFGAFVLTQLPAWNRWYLAGDEAANGVLLLIFSAGIAIGAGLAGWLAGRYRLPVISRAGGWVMSLSLLMLGLFSPERQDLLLALDAWLAQPGTARLGALLLSMSIGGGLYIVPLYTLLQQRAEPSRLARMVAANNVLNALFMVASAVLGALLPAAGLDLPSGFLLLAGLGLLFLRYGCERQRQSPG